MTTKVYFCLHILKLGQDRQNILAEKRKGGGLSLNVQSKGQFYAKFLGSFSLDFNGQRLWLKGSPQKKSMQLLMALLKAGAEGATRQQLLEVVWKEGGDPQKEKSNLNQHLYYLRQLIHESHFPEGKYIIVQKPRYYFTEDYEIHSDTEQLDQIWEDIRNAEAAGEDTLELCTVASQIHPYDEWQAVQIDCLVAMNRYKDALKVYEDAAEFFYEDLGVSSLNRTIARYRNTEGRLHYLSSALAGIRKGLNEEERLWGAYCCSYPSFVDVYRIVVRMQERTGIGSLLMVSQTVQVELMLDPGITCDPVTGACIYADQLTKIDWEFLVQAQNDNTPGGGDPGDPGGGSPGNPGGGSPGGNPPTVITETDVPLTTMIPDEEVPLAILLPKTGDNSHVTILAVISAGSFLLLILLGAAQRKNRKQKK